MYSNPLNLSTRYLYETEKDFPGYFSDREKHIVIFNVLHRNNEWENLFYWIGYLDARSNHPYVHLALGIVLLDHYLLNTNQDMWLKEAIKHLGKADKWLDSEESIKAISAVQALAFYLNRDFEKAIEYLGVRKNQSFEEEFTELIKKVA